MASAVSAVETQLRLGTLEPWANVKDAVKTIDLNVEETLGPLVKKMPLANETQNEVAAVLPLE